MLQIHDDMDAIEMKALLTARRTEPPRSDAYLPSRAFIIVGTLVCASLGVAVGATTGSSLVHARLGDAAPATVRGAPRKTQPPPRAANRPRAASADALEAERVEPPKPDADAPPRAVAPRDDIPTGPPDRRPFLVVPPAVSPAFAHQAFAFKCASEYDLTDALARRSASGFESLAVALRADAKLAEDEPSFRDIRAVTARSRAYNECFARKFSSLSPGAAAPSPAPVRPEDWTEHRGRMIGMFRAPAQRIAAGFANAFEGCPAMRAEFGERCDPSGRAYVEGDCVASLRPNPSSVRRYFACVRGCQTNLLNGIPCGGEDGSGEGNHVPTKEEIAAAVARVSGDDFAVVGVANKYVESVRRLKTALERPALGGTASERAAVGLAAARAKKGLELELGPLVLQERGSGTAAEARAAAEAKVAELLRAWKLVDDADAAVYAAAVAKFDARTRQLENIALAEATAKAEAAEAAAKLAKAEAAKATAEAENAKAKAKQEAKAKQQTEAKQEAKMNQQTEAKQVAKMNQQTEAKLRTEAKPKPLERAATRKVAGDTLANPAKAERRAGGA